MMQMVLQGFKNYLMILQKADLLLQKISNYSTVTDLH
jgi:hypothetical protein